MKTILTFLALSLLTFKAYSSELFIRVNKSASFYAMVGVQTHYNNSNTFRFFDLPQGQNIVKIYYSNSSDLFYTGTINLDYNQRIVCEISENGYLNIVQQQSLSIQNWYTSTVSSSSGYNDNSNFGNSSSNAGYQEFLKMLNNESFDSGKLDQGKKYISKTTLSAAQIADIAKTFSFDSNRLEWAKYAYQYCHDKQNYFMLKATFAFTTNYSELEKFIEGK